MPLGAPIGTNRGLETKTMITQLMENCTVPIVVDAGIGQPISLAVQAGRMAYLAELADKSHLSQASSPLTAFRDNLISLGYSVFSWFLHWCGRVRG